MGTVVLSQTPVMLTLPSDAVRQIQWRFADRFDLQMLVQSARGVARGTVARLVSAGERNTHEWTPGKQAMLQAFDSAGVTAAFMEPEEGGFIAGPKNLALSLAAFELAWVDGGAATASLASCLALAPIHERGTAEQVARYMTLAAPPIPGEDRQPWRGAFALTEPIPYVGVDTGMLSGKLTIAKWNDGEEPVLQVDKRGRFITGIAFANFVTAAVNSADARIKGSCVVILEETDEGIFDRGTATKKLVHQLSSTGDPVFNLKVPASRIVGGYTVKDGVIVPNYNHGEVIEAVFRRTRVPVGLMTASKLLSAVEPVIRYQRQRFRGAEGARPGSLRYEQGIQQREDALHRLVDVWAVGEAAASLGFAAARLFDALDPLEKQKNAILAGRGVQGGRTEMKALREFEQRAVESLSMKAGDARRAELEADPLVQFVLADAEANVLCPATKLWNTGHGANMLREAVSLMGGYGITEDCPGFLANKWMDAQLEATYEGPEAVQRRQLTVTMTSEVFLALFRSWICEMRAIASHHPGTGACTLASAMHLWLWSLNYLQNSTDADGNKLYHGQRQGVTFPLADALAWLLASRSQILDVLELEQRGASDPVASEGLEGTVQFLSDLCHTQVATAAGEASRICAELVFGYNAHPSWDEQEHRSCFSTAELEELEETMPGICAMAVDVITIDGGHPQKAAVCGLRWLGGVFAAAVKAHHMPDRFASGQRSSGRNGEQGDDPGGARLPGGRMNMSTNSQPQIEGDRQTMEVDITCAGFGPATGGFLTTLTRAWTENPADPAFESRVAPGMPLQVICYERADSLDAGVSGVVTRAKGIRASFPNLNPAEIPMAAEVRKERVLYLLDSVGARRSTLLRFGDALLRIGRKLWLKDEAFELPWTPGFLHKNGGLILSIGQFNQWVASQIMSAGFVQIWPGSPVAGPIVAGDKVEGLRLVDQGADKIGAPADGFMPGMDVRALLTVIGDGPVGQVSRALNQNEDSAKRDWALGMKFVIELPEDTELEAGTVWHTFGFPEPEIFGFLYVHPERLVSVGIFVPSWMSDPTRTSYRYLQHFILHPALWKHLKNGTLRSWGAKSLEETGKRGELALAGNGFARIGECSGSTNMLTGSGVDEAWTTGVQLGQAVLALLRSGGEFTQQNLEATYEKRRRESWVEEGSREAEHARDGFHKGFVRGLIGMALAGISNGRFSFRAHIPQSSKQIKRFGNDLTARLSLKCAAELSMEDGRPLHDAMMTARGWPEIPFDGRVLVSQQDALLMGGKIQAMPGFADHVVFLDKSHCIACVEKTCIAMCSGQAITLGLGNMPAFEREKCVHCGACLWNCANPPEGKDSNIEFRAGSGGSHSAEN